ncbi:MAG: sigma-70 family RNA polymerase sigma factor [Planctomycetota bacterium]
MDHAALDRAFARYRKSGGADALADLFDVAAEGLFALAVQLLRDPNAAEDVLQETFLDLARGVQRHDGQRAAWPYLAGMIRNRALAHRRREGRVIDEDRLRAGEVVDPTPDQVAERGELAAWLRAAVAELPEASRRILGHVLQDGLRPAEIAERLGLSPGAVRAALHRGVARLRERAPAAGMLPLSLAPYAGRGMEAVREAVLAEAGAASAAPGALAGSGGAKAGSILGGKLAVAGLALMLVTGGGLLWRAMATDEPEVLTPRASTLDTVADRSAAKARREAGRSAPPQSLDEGELPGADPDLEREEKVTLTASTSGSVGLPGGVSTGEFVLKIGEGYSFASASVVPAEKADFTYDEDLVMRAPNGLVADLANAGLVRDRSPVALMDAFVEFGSAPPVPARLGRTRLRAGDSMSHFFAIPLKEGGWALVAYVEAQAEGTLFRYRKTTDPAGRFGGASRIVHRGGALFDGEVLERSDPIYAAAIAAVERRAEVLRGALASLDARAASIPVTGTTDSGLRVAAILDRSRASGILDAAQLCPHWMREPESPAYQASTFSFEHALRDDPGRLVTRNDWGISFEGGMIDVRTVTSDQSRIWALPPDADAARITAEMLGTGVDRLEPTEGSSYLVHTLDRDTDQWTYLKILEHRPEESVVFAWANLDPDRLSDGVLFSGRQVMNDDRVVVRMRMGHDGGSPSEVFLDATHGHRIDELTPVDADRVRAWPIPSNDKTVAGIEGAGSFPRGRTCVTRVVWEGAVGKEGGAFKIVVGGQELAKVEEVQPWMRGEWQGRLELDGADLRRSFVSAAYFTAVEVTFEGHFE